jgi:hypothetical protein
VKLQNPNSIKTSQAIPSKSSPKLPNFNQKLQKKSTTLGNIFKTMIFFSGFPLNNTENVTSSGGMKTKSENQRDICGFEEEKPVAFGDLDFYLKSNYCG